MMNCQSFRERFRAGTEDAALLGHIRSCDACLDVAANVDPEVMFRAIGGEMIPPGGVEAFVDDVMRQVRVRDVESAMVPAKVISWPRRLAVAATIAAGITGALLFNRADAPTPAHVTPVRIARSITPVSPAKLATKPVVETYESEKATIVEVPAESGGDDVKIVMIFDENLPADL